MGLLLLVGVLAFAGVRLLDDRSDPATASGAPGQGATTAPITGGPATSPTTTGKPTKPVKPRRPAPIVVLISVDGLNPDAITQLEPTGRLPAFRRLMSEGAGTLNARTSVEITKTLPNHTGMLTGRRILGPTGTGVTFNEDNGGTLERLNGRYVPGIFDVAHDHGMSTTFLAEKDKFNFLIRSWDGVHGARDRIRRDDGRDKLDTAEVAPARTLAQDLIRQLTARPARLSFLHVAAPDLTGHASGFMSARYLEAVVAADEEVNRVLEAILASPDLRARTTVILTADHGGRGPNHSDERSIHNYRIPFFVWGRGVTPGDLYRPSSGRTDPGTSRPGYDGPQPVRNLDAADLALSLLGLDPLPDTLTGGLRVLSAE